MIAVLLLVSASFAASDDETAWAFLYGPLAVLFLPALYVSLARVSLRGRVLKLSAAAALCIGLGSVAIDYGVPLLIAPPMVLLAQGAGLIFQRR